MLTKAEVRNVLPFGEGDKLTDEQLEAVMMDLETLATALTVARVELSFVCCTANGLFQVYVGIQESQQADRLYLVAPSATIQLSTIVVENFNEFLDRMAASVLRGSKLCHALSCGHCAVRKCESRRQNSHFR